MFSDTMVYKVLTERERTMKKKKVLTMALGFLLTAVMAMPSVAFAETWGSGDSEKEKGSDVIVDYEPGEPGGGYDNPERINSIRFKSGELAPFTFYNAEDEIGGRELDSIGKPRLAYAQLEDWVQVATKIYSSMSQIGGSGLSGVTWDGPTAQPGVQGGNGYTLTGENAVNAGDYEARATLEDGYRYWEDGVMVKARSIPYAIAPAKVEIPAARKLTYNGNQQTGVAATPGSVVKNNAQVNAGAYTATAELQSKENYRWNDGTTADKSIKWSIDKADTPFTVNGKTAKVKYKKLKKKIQRVKQSRVLTVSKAQGTVAYRKISVGSKKTNKKYGRKISINSSNGNVTVKRGLKKGTYKVKVEVSDGGNNNYNGSTRTVTFKIKVK